MHFAAVEVIQFGAADVVSVSLVRYIQCGLIIEALHSADNICSTTTAIATTSPAIYCQDLHFT